MKQATILTICLFILQSLSAQHISVESFTKLENDMDARVHHPQKDQNAEVAALIKIVTTETGFSFDGGSLGIVNTEQKVAEIWVYVPRGAQRITIMHPKLGVLRNYAYPEPIESATVYEMRLVTGRVETTVIPAELESQWLLITAEPNTALIYLDDNFEATGILQKRLLPGNYTYRIENNLYHTEAGRITVTAERRAELNVTLKANFGFIEVKSTPETGARVQINGRDAGYTTNGKSEQLQSGDYTVTVIKEQFQQASRKVSVKDNETTTLTLDMAPNFVTLEAKLPADATFFINNEQKGRGNWNGRLSAGVYTFEARKDKHQPAKQDMQLKLGDNPIIELVPQPITGSLDVLTIPPQATIKLNGKDYGTTPNTIRNLLIGEYTLLLEKQGFATLNKNITVSEGGSTLVNETLPAGRNITITSLPSGAELFINGQRAGETPYEGELSFGKHVIRLVNSSVTLEESIEITQGGKQLYSFDVQSFKCGDEVSFLYQGKTVTYGTVLSNGRCWMDRNLGAGRVAQSSTDEQAYGDLYQWGRGTDGHEKRTSGTTSTLSSSDTPGHDNFILPPSRPYDWRSSQNNNLWQGVNGTNNPCPQGFRLPTEAEWEAERQSWSSNNAAGAFNSPLKLPVAGVRSDSNGSLYSVGSNGGYWSASVDGTFARGLNFGSSGAGVYSDSRADGFSVRCLKD